MPVKNGTGPMGAGPLLGRGFGNCAGRGQGAAGQLCVGDVRQV